MSSTGVGHHMLPSSSYMRTPPFPQASSTALPAPVGWVNAISPRAGLSGQPRMNVSAAAESSLDAMPRRRCSDDTNRRGMPMGVGSGCGCTYRFVEESTGSRDSGAGEGRASESCDKERVDCDEAAVEGWVWEEDGEESAAETSAGRAMAIAVEMRCATTQPTIFSRVLAIPGAESRKR